MALLIVLFGCCVSVFGQQRNNKAVSLSLEGATVEQLVQQLERESEFKFFYDSLQFRDFKVSLHVKELSVEEVLQKAFNGTDFSYTIDRHGNIFLLKNQLILTSLPEGIFNNDSVQRTNKPAPGAEKEDADLALVLSQLAEQREEKIDISPENKIHEIGLGSGKSSGGNVNLSGYVRDVNSGEPVVGAAVFIKEPMIGVTTDAFGYYSITLPKGRHTLFFKVIGMKDTHRSLLLIGDGKLDVELREEVSSLKEVTVSAEKTRNVKSVQMGVEKIDIKQIKQVPSVLGEPDILRVVLTLPGVKTVGEATTGFNVRGGATDQNLILFNGTTIYNPSHFFGLFSAFNPELVKNVELYKSSIPAKYGGRLSSVLEVNSREGNKKKFTGSAGIGLLTSRLNLEGPIIKDKTSFNFGARTTYSNWLLNLLPDDSGYKDGSASFYDVNLHVSHQVNEENNLYFTGYFSKDRFGFSDGTMYGYKNENANLKWQHIFNNRLNGVFSAGYDRYDYYTSANENPVNAYQMDFDISQRNLKSDFSYFLNSNHTIDFGFSSIYYQLNPGSYKPFGEKSLVVADKLEKEQALESAFYVGDQFDVNSRLSVNLGLRYSVFNYLGPKKVLAYREGFPKEDYTLFDSVYYKKGSIINTYQGPEFRLSARYAFSDDFSVKAAYNTLRQYIHMLSNTTAISPTDTWKLSDPNIRPQQGDQLSLGFYKNLKSHTIETSVEVYYKNIKSYLDYKSGAQLLMNHRIETDVVNTRGKAYGAEFMLKKKAGKLNGWMSYTYSRTLLKMDDPNAGEVINGGDYYAANFDKPHDFSLISNYRVSHRFSVSLNTNYSTGRPITVPIGKFYYAGSERSLYSDRNTYRIPDYFRMDLAFNIEGNHKLKQLTHNSWTIGIYNLTGRKNPYSVYFVSENERVHGYKLSIFGTAIPFVNFNLRF